MMIADHFIFCFLGTQCRARLLRVTNLPFQKHQESIFKEWNQREGNPICDQRLSVRTWIVLNCPDGSTTVKKTYGIHIMFMQQKYHLWGRERERERERDLQRIPQSKERPASKKKKQNKKSREHLRKPTSWILGHRIFKN